MAIEVDLKWSQHSIRNSETSVHIEVDQLPADVISGRDPQLEKAIEVIMVEIEKYALEKLKRPPYPKKQ